MPAAPQKPPIPAVGREGQERIALFLPSLDGGGAERAFVNLARGMSDLGRQVDFVVANAAGVYRSEVPASATLIDLGASRMALALPGLIRYLRRRRPSRLYSALEEANIIALLARRLSGTGTPVYPSLRNTLSDELATSGSRKLAIMVGLARRLYPSAAGIVAVSAGVADDAAALLGVPRAGITVIANPTLTPELAELAKAPLDDPWFVPGAPPVFLGVGRLTPQKDFATLIRAFAMVRQHRAGRLVILGEGPLRADLQTLAGELGVAQDVRLQGFDPNPFRYMSRCAVFVLSSLYEGSPNVVVQALATGAAIVATDCRSGPREILEGVQSARLVGIGDAGAMARAMDDLLDPAIDRAPPPSLAAFDYRASAAAYLGMA